MRRRFFNQTRHGSNTGDNPKINQVLDFFSHVKLGGDTTKEKQQQKKSKAHDICREIRKKNLLCLKEAMSDSANKL